MSKRKTNEEFINEVFQLVGSEYTILSNYINAREKVEIIHNTCGHSWKLTPDSFLRGNRCPRCGGNMKKSTEMFKNEVYNLVGNEYEVVSDYVNTATKLYIQHNKCNTQFKVTPNSFLSGSRCPYCSGKWMNQNQFTERVFNLVGDEYEVIGEYISAKEKVIMKHKSCNNTYLVKPNNFFNGRRCPHCFARNKKRSHEEFLKEVFDLVGNEYMVISEYKYNKTKITLKHNKCNTIYNVQPIAFLSGCRCPKCAKNMKKTTAIFKREVFKLVENEYEVIGDYMNDASKIRIKHTICSCEYAVTPRSFLNGSRCPSCKVSKGEEKIKGILDELNLFYIPQYKFEDCRNKLPLPFDFAIFDDGNKLTYLIEYDGEQHFEPIKHFGGESRFEEVKFSDGIKNIYCENNNIKLIRIPYWEFDSIEEILHNEINKN